jgi:serine/threonine-protein kinase RsbW
VGTSLHLEIANSLESLAAAAGTASVWLQEHAVPPAAAMLGELGLEELVTNCIKYSYDDARARIIHVDFWVTDDLLRVQVTDDGRPFDPGGAPVPDTSLPPELRASGGLGLHLLRAMADRMSYERRGDLNVVTLEKSLA